MTRPLIVLWGLCLILSPGAAAQFDRDWKVFVVPFSHTDVGFTAPVPEVVRQHRQYLDDVVAYVDQTRSNPLASQFKWTIEITWVLEDYLANRSPAQIEALMDHVRAGRIEIAAMHFGLQTDLAGPEELVRSLYFAQELKNTYDVPIRTAVTNDTPGFTWSLAQLLAKAKIPYASLAMNSFLSDFYETTTLPNLFYWESQSGDRTLLWRSMHPRWAYLEGSVWGLYSAYAAMVPRITAQLNKLAATGYPYDVVLINAATGDNGAPNLRITENVRTWNQAHEGARMYVATFSEFFDYVTEHVTQDIPVFRGDMPNWWSWGFAASSTGGFLKSRKAQVELTVAETFASMADALAPGFVYPTEELRRGYINNLLFEDHNLGALNPASNAPFWERKTAWITAAAHAGETILHDALDALARTIRTGAEVTVAVFNPLPWERTDVVHVPLTDSRLSYMNAFCVMDAVTGAERPVQRLPTGEVAFQAVDVPPLGYRLYHVQPASGPWPPPQLLRRPILENDHYRVQVDLATGGITSILDKNLGAELTRSDARFNQYAYNRSVPFGFQVMTSDSGQVLQQITLRGMAPGARSYVTTITLPVGQRRIGFSNQYDKHPVSGFEGVDFFFNFGLPEANLRYEIPFGHVSVFEDELSGFRTNHYAMQRWASITGGNMSAILASNGPAVHAYAGGRFDGNVRLLTSFNTLGTAYRAGVGPLHAGFALTSHGGHADPARAAEFAYNFNVPLLSRVLPARQPGIRSDAHYSFLSIEGATLQLSTLKKPLAGGGFIVRLFNPSAEPVDVDLQFGPEVFAASAATLLEDITGPIGLTGKQAHLTFAPFEVKTLHLDLELATRRGESAPTGETVRLEPNFPNPFSDHTTFHYELAQLAKVRLTTYDLLGRVVGGFRPLARPPGRHTFVWAGSDLQGYPLASGVYIVTLEAVADDGGYTRRSRSVTIIR